MSSGAGPRLGRQEREEHGDRLAGSGFERRPRRQVPGRVDLPGRILATCLEQLQSHTWLAANGGNAYFASALILAHASDRSEAARGDETAGFGGYTQALLALFSDWTVESPLNVAGLLAEEDNVPSTGGVCVCPQALSHPESGMVLVGDTGHGMWPSLGQGCNAALESVSVLANVIEAVGGRDGRSGLNIQIGGTEVRGTPHSPVMFKVQMALFMLLNKVTAGLVPMPAMFRIMKGDSARYLMLKSAMKVEKYVTCGTVIGVAGSALGLGLGLFK
ncbi:hypothetical protein ACHAWF_001261 [Thalassiosira exigua]